MATLYITEFAFEGADYTGHEVQVAMQPPVAEQTVAIAGASAQSAALNGNTRLVRVSPDAICSVLFGSNPTALTTSMRMAAGQVEYFAVQPGTTKIAVISNT